MAGKTTWDLANKEKIMGVSKEGKSAKFLIKSVSYCFTCYRLLVQVLNYTPKALDQIVQ